MEEFNDWWRHRSKAEAVTMTIACLIFILLAGVDIGRALYQATH